MIHAYVAHEGLSLNARNARSVSANARKLHLEWESSMIHRTGGSLDGRESEKVIELLCSLRQHSIGHAVNWIQYIIQMAAHPWHFPNWISFDSIPHLQGGAMEQEGNDPIAWPSWWQNAMTNTHMSCNYRETKRAVDIICPPCHLIVTHAYSFLARYSGTYKYATKPLN